MTGREAVLPLIALAVTLLGCAGEGTGLDEFGNRVNSPRSELGPTLRSLQENIFTPICTQCHTGAIAPLGLALDAGAARKNLVGVSSSERPELLRVAPGEPESSYLVWKIEGRTGIVGGRMPLGLSPLSAEQISAVRGWIANGALEDGASQ